MEIIKNINGNKLDLSLTGRLDTTTAPELDEVLKESLEGVSELVIDMDKLEYISSAGLRSLLVAQKTMNKNGIMKIKNVNDMIMEVFKVTGFADIMNIE
ncbi:MAG: STAS domain-containing protein [Lachnospiraceae bacterium]|nr:STAS domain-containing protein [Lachnospiraceae bacterium]